MKKLVYCLKNYCENTSGATAIEYGLLAALLGVGLISSYKLIGGGTNSMWSELNNKVGDEL